MTNQTNTFFSHANSPNIKRVVGGIGDVNVPDYDGGFVYVHTQTPNAFDWEYVIVPGDEHTWDCKDCGDCGLAECNCEYVETCDGHGESSCIACKGTGKNPDLYWEVYSGIVELPDWVDWDDVAQTSGEDPNELRAVWVKDETDENVMARMSAIESAAGYHGWQNFDQYPDRLTYAEIKERYAGFDMRKVVTKARNEESELAAKYS